MFTNNKIKSYLSKQGELFDQGFGVTKDTINKIIQRSEKSISINSEDPNVLPTDYIDFLNEFGAFQGEKFCINGPISRWEEDQKNWVMLLDQHDIECSFRNIVREAEKKSCWAITEGNVYYINLSITDKGPIYSIDHIGNSKIFAESISEFSDKFVKIYENEKTEKSIKNNFVKK